MGLACLGLVWEGGLRVRGSQSDKVTGLYPHENAGDELRLR